MDNESAVQQASLKRLDVLVGRWAMESPQFPEVHGEMVFAWLDEGPYLRQRTEAKDSPFPTSLNLIGLDDASGAFTMLYSDSRGVSRVYQMTLEGREWKIWREAPGFSQRFHGTISEDGIHITASWEKMLDGSHWEHDFDLVYTREPAKAG